MLKRQFRPEFLNRLDEIVFYKPLTREEIGKIVDLMLKSLNARLADKPVSYTHLDVYKRQAYNSVYGQVESGWQKVDGGWKFSLAIPVNCTASLKLPGKPAVLLEAGTYTF